MSASDNGSIADEAILGRAIGSSWCRPASWLLRRMEESKYQKEKGPREILRPAKLSRTALRQPKR